MKTVHEGNERGEAGVEIRDIEDHQPRQEQAGEDVGLENEPHIVQKVLPSLPPIPPNMLEKMLRCRYCQLDGE
ncbi:hypothetical protein KSD_96780 [Ktedonobacter sp. SOSP1-85]|nr:hypothetical protein KSD_96780 [Ktedonobacter sp. SOSP1-85]